MSSVVIFSRNGVVAEWNKQGADMPVTVSGWCSPLRGRPDYVEKRASKVKRGVGAADHHPRLPADLDRSHDWCAHYDNDVEISSLYEWSD
jgi:hypothetical protein